MHATDHASTTSAPIVDRVIVVHGYGASPDSHWFPWLARSLGSGGIDVDVVGLPSPDAPEQDAWTDAVADVLMTADHRTWVVAHSLGAITVLRALARDADARLGGLIVVSGFTGPLTALPVLDDHLAGDVDVESLVPRIIARLAVRSDDDPYVPPAATDALAARLGADVHVVEGAGHFLASDGVVELPLLLDLIPGASP